MTPAPLKANKAAPKAEGVGGGDPASIWRLFLSPEAARAEPEARDVALQDRLIDICTEISGVDLPRN